MTGMAKGSNPLPGMGSSLPDQGCSTMRFWTAESDSIVAARANAD